jgi:hypothetical protein
MKKQKLTVSGHLVQHAYMVQCLRLVHEFGALRVLTIAYAMFPRRAQTAASAAAKRVVSNALKLGYLVCKIEPDSRRYYALTLLGARVLNSSDDRYRVRSTTKALVFHRHEHREWCNVVALAARHRGLSSYSEAQIKGTAHGELMDVFKHMPDALTYYTDTEGRACVAWHEVDLSRRSTKDKQRLAHLVHTLITQRFLTHENQQHNINLVMHCGTAKIKRENHSVIDAALQEHSDDVLSGPAAYEATISEGEDFRVFQVDINELPETVEGTWGSSLPWPGAPGAVSSGIDVFMQPIEA